MKFFPSASSIALLALCGLTGCAALGIPDIFAPDQVPQSARDEPQIVVAKPVAPDTPWPRLGDVPSKPKDFSTKPVYDNEMNQLTADRAQAEAAKKAAAQQPVFSPIDGVTPPQLPQE
ncbi:MAG: hypothetical protein KGI37_07470 [Alphaproteobacteria bacterium]|nr:hypothetical protein [Alphaproteobacteria bacterium]